VSIRFGPFAFDPTDGTVVGPGLTTRLFPQSAKILEYLAIRAPRPVSRDELKEVVWPHRPFGDRDNGLNFCIRQIRLALGEGQGSAGLLETIRGTGYRLAATITTDASVAQEPAHLVAHLSDVVVIADSAARILYANPAIQAITGFPVNHLLGKSVLDFVVAQDRGTASRALAECAIEPGRSLLVRLRVISRGDDGTWKDVRLHNCLKIPDIHGIVMVFRDLSTQRLS
jgi:PAS domain S-box-containing protein